MSVALLRTKLHVPPPRAGIVPRRHLVERLREGRRQKLTLLSAPPGFGKTTLVSEWITNEGVPAAWLSLDEGDNVPARFLAYLVAALRTADASIGESVHGLLDHSQPPSAEAVLTTLLNDLSALDTSIVLVLDDYHRIDSPEIDETLAFLLEHLPAQLHLVITTRQDPRLPLNRLRSRGEMTELRAADLRFSDIEAAAFLRDVMKLDLSPDDLEALDSRTEGWIAGLQLAALSMQGRDDIPGFIDDFAGDHRYIVDYLLDEVLSRQPEGVREFLLQTSILDRLGSDLCDAVTGRTDARQQLPALERANLFVMPLDDTRRWYRYHHLFADALRARLLDDHPDQVAGLHDRASAWYEQDGDLAAAIHHAFAAGNVSRAADLVERSVPAMGRSRQETTLLSWFNALPDDVIRVRPVLSVDYAGTILQTGGDPALVEARLRDAERWLDPVASPEGMIVGDIGSFRRLPGQIAVYRAGQALVQGDVAGTMSHANAALDLLPQHDDFGRGAAAGLLGLASWASGRLDEAHRMYTECMDRLRRAGFISDLFGCALALADIRIAQGRLHDAMATCERAIQLPAGLGLPTLRGTADMHVGMSGIHLEWNDRDAAMQHLMTSEELGEHMGLPQTPYRWRVVMALLREAEGDVDAALELLDEAERRYVGDFFPNIRPIPALKARLWAAHGSEGEALRWAREQGLSPGDDLSYLREYEHVTLARILLARYRHERDAYAIDELTAFLSRLLDAAETGARIGSVIEILILQALAHEARGDIPTALVSLERALSLAGPEGYIRLFISEGPPMRTLLGEASARGLMPEYISRLLAAFHGGAGESEPAWAAGSPSQSLPEPLSARELDVLRLIADGLSNKEIADRLFVALDTVKGHNRRLFAKLDVQRRTEAISRARELGLL